MIRKTGAISIILLTFCFQQLIAQKEKPDYRKLHYLSEEEMYMDFDASRDFYVTDPPSGPIRNVAEFEEMQSVLVRYPLNIPVSLVKEMAEDCRVLTIVLSSSQQQTALNYYQGNDVNTANCDFLIAPSDSEWTRDYGPWFIFDGDKQPGIINFPYNRPRPNDNDVPIEVADNMGIDLYGMNLETAGGNYMCDGMGKAASTDLIWDENGQYTHGEIDQLVNDYLGIEEYFVTEDPLDDYIEHIDCWGKFLSPGKILIGQVPQSDYRYDDYETLANYFANTISSYGVPYEVFRVYTPGLTQTVPYTNSLILNKKVLVPITGSQWDDEALTSYEEAMPGYEIVGIFYNNWYNTDALHCRTKGIADIGMLYFHHVPLSGEVPFEQSIEISTELIAYSGEDIYTDSVFIVYNINNSVYDSVLMTHQNGDTWTGILSNISAGDEIDYYLYASDESGRQANHPFIGMPDPHEFSIAIPPEVYDISFWCTDAETGDDLSGAYVSIDGLAIVSDEDGLVLFEDYAPGTYNYIAYKDGYVTYDGTVAVIDQNVEEFVELSPEMLFDISFWCTEAGSGDPLEGAYVSINGETLSSDEDGLVLFEDYAPGTYNYIAYKGGYVTYNGTVAVIDQNVEEFVELSPEMLFDIYFWCSDAETGDELSGAHVSINGVALLTDENGLALFENYQPGEYDYAAYKDSYITQNGTVTVTDQDVEEFVELSPEMLFNISFWCSELIVSGALPGVEITIEGSTLISDQDGLAYFEEYAPGIYDYTAFKPGYTIINGSVEVVDQNIEEFVVMSPLTEELVLNPDTVLFLEETQMYEGIELQVNSNMDVPVMINSITEYGMNFPWYVEEMPILPYQLMEGSTLNLNIMVNQLVSLQTFYDDTLYIETDNKIYKSIIMIDSTLLLSGTEEMSRADVSVYPNPFKDRLNIGFTLTDQAEYTFTIYDISGKLVDRMMAAVAAGSHVITWDSDHTNLENGYYMYKFEAGNVLKSGKIILTR